LQVVNAGAHANFQQLFPVRAGKLRHRMDERLFFIARPLNALKPLAAALRSVAHNLDGDAARRAFPVLPHLLIQ
jgi:hypothetical protein